MQGHATAFFSFRPNAATLSHSGLCFKLICLFRFSLQFELKNLLWLRLASLLLSILGHILT